MIRHAGYLVRSGRSVPRHSHKILTAYLSRHGRWCASADQLQAVPARGADAPLAAAPAAHPNGIAFR